MKILQKLTTSNFPFKWVDITFLPNSAGIRKEIYVINNEDTVDELVLLFYSLFGNIKNEILIYDSYWWDFCLDTWNISTNEYDYEIEGKSIETGNYLQMLKDSDIEIGFSGSCECNDWDKFLTIILRCIINHTAPYSPKFYHNQYDFFFYFHHTGSIGLYYSSENEAVKKILEKAGKEYEVKDYPS